MPNAADIMRETADLHRRWVETQAEDSRNSARRQLFETLSGLAERAHRLSGARELLGVAEASLNNLRERHATFSGPGSAATRSVTTSAVLCAAYPAVYVLDLMLLSGNAKHIAKDFAQGNDVLTAIAILSVPLAILALEASFQTQWAIAATTGRKLLWGTVSVLMCIAMPAIIIGFSASTIVTPTGARGAQVQNWHLVGKAVMAFFAHAAILLGGNWLHQAKHHLVFKVNDMWSNRRVSGLGAAIRRDAAALSTQFTEYYRGLREFNAGNPDARVEAGPFDSITREEVNLAFGYEIIAGPPDGPAATDSGSGSSGSGSPNRAADTPSDPERQPERPNAERFNYETGSEDEVRT